MNDTQLIDDLRAQMDAWTAADEPDLAALLVPHRRRPSRTLWAAGGVTVTAGAAAAAVLVAQAGAPAPSAIPPARAGTAPSSLDASIKAAIRTGPESMPVFASGQVPVPVARDDSADLANAQWFSVASVESGQYTGTRRIFFAHNGVAQLEQGGRLIPLDDRAIQFGDRMMNWDQLNALSASVPSVTKLIGLGSAVPTEDSLADAVVSSYAESPAKLLLREAIATALQRVDGATTEFGTKDSRGRASMRIVFATADHQTVWLDIDPSNFRLLEWSRFAGKGFPVEPTASVPSSSADASVAPPSPVIVPAGRLEIRSTYLSWTYDGPPAG